LLTLLNAPKPLLVDDAAYYYFARQFAHDPLHPYGFEMFWYQWPQPANDILAPPVLPFWWSLGLRLFGDTPFMWKLWLWPFALLLVFALHALLRRFAHGLELPLVWLTVLSPSVLPAFNLMLDVPAAALGLAALALYLRAFGRRSLWGGLGAGLLAGLAMQTKYTCFMVPAVMLLYGVVFGHHWRRLGVTVLAVSAAAALFVGWEIFIACQHGRAHFLANRPQFGDWQEWWEEKTYLAIALLPMLGGLAPAVSLLGLTAWRCPGWAVVLVGLLLASCYLAVGLGSPQVGMAAQLLYGSGGLLWAGVVLASAACLCLGPQGRAMPSWGQGRAISIFLTCWLLGEVAAYFLLSPFPAARRLLGLVIVATLVVGRFAARTCRLPRRRQSVRRVVLAGLFTGCLFYVVDLADAFAAKHAAEAAAATIAELTAHDAQPPRVWYVGHWGFQFYAERAGMRAVVPDTTQLLPGDWLVVPSAPTGHVERQRIRLDAASTRAERGVLLGVPLPWRTVMCYYGGYVPLERHEGPRLEITIYRVVAPWVPRTPP